MAGSDKLRVGFIGASGMMGHGMAKNILAKGHPLALTVHRNSEAVKDLLAAGATQVKSAAALAAASDVVFLCVTGSPQVEQQFAGDQGLLQGGRKGLYIVDCSTSEPDSTARLREAAEAKGMSLIDAPLARTPLEAEEGRLNVMIGASDEDFRALEPVLKTFAENVFHVGQPGAGHTVKLLNNFIAQAICTAAAEAFAVGVQGRHRSEETGGGRVRRRRQFGPFPGHEQDLVRRHAGDQVRPGQRPQGCPLLHSPG